MAGITTTELRELAKDTGCEFHNDCLSCPFPECVYENPLGVVTAKRNLRYKQMVEKAATMTAKEVAKEFNVCMRTVKRALMEYG